MKRYHPLLVALHWFLAIMILVALVIGGPGLADIDNSDPGKLFALTGHMVWGMVIGVLMIVRFTTRMLSKKPPIADAGHPALNVGARLAHTALYVLVFLMVGSGLGIALTANLFPIAFGGSEAQLPASFDGLAARVAHGAIATILLTFLVLHVLGWAYHQFVRRDGLISRMWFGKRV